MSFILFLVGLAMLIVDEQFGGQGTLGLVFTIIGGGATLLKWLFVTFVVAAATQEPRRRFPR